MSFTITLLGGHIACRMHYWNGDTQCNTIAMAQWNKYKHRWSDNCFCLPWKRSICKLFLSQSIICCP